MVLLESHLEILPEFISIMMLSLSLNIVYQLGYIPTTDRKGAVCALPSEIAIGKHLMVDKMR